MARPPEGPGIAAKLEGPDESKHRLKVILETISGTKTIEEAAAAIGVGAARFHELRKEVLQAALVALEPKPAGRPRAEANEPDPRIAELEGQIREMTIEIKASHVREQIALTMPHLLQPSPDEPAPQKKTKPSKVLDRIHKDRHRRRR
jgi:hypothetical protein